MKKVLIIGADFVPSSLPPATRIRFFAKHLEEFGWEPIILTTKPEYYDWQVDHENEQLLPAHLNVVRTNAWQKSWTRRLGIGDVGMRSMWHHWPAVKRICKDHKVDLVFIPVPPSVPMVLGRLAHRKFGIPYVVDYIDPWVTEYYWKVPRQQRPPKWPLAYAMSRVLEPFALKKVSHITGVSKGTTDSVVNRYPGLSASDATEIPYGAEPDDFNFLRQHPRAQSVFDKGDGLFHLSYVGACIPGMHPTVRALFKAVRTGLDTQADIFARLRIHFIGTSYATNGSARAQLPLIAREFGIEDKVDEHTGRVPYLESLQIMLDSDGLFLIGSDEPHYTASKVFTYLLASRPLLSIFHEESSVIGFLTDNAAARTISYGPTRPPATQVEAITRALSEMLLAEGCPNHREQLDTFSARAMTARLAEALDKAMAKARNGRQH